LATIASGEGAEHPHPRIPATAADGSRHLSAAVPLLLRRP
jgi:hypothetical protein